MPRKNIAPIAGKPLIYHTISEALKVKQIDDLVVSTEDPEIADISKSLGAQVPFYGQQNLQVIKRKLILF